MINNIQSKHNRIYKMVVLDIDGTLLNNDKRLTQENTLAVKRLIDKGIQVVLCSGRIFNGARVYAKELGLSGYIIACNGAVIRTVQRDKMIYSQSLQNDDSEAIISICKANNIYIHAYISDVLVTEKLDYTSQIYFERNNELEKDDRIEIKVVRDLKEHFLKGKERISKFVIISDNPAKLIKVREEVSKISTIEVSTSAHNNIEIMDRGVNKGKALEILCNHLSIPVSEVAAIGDNENDISLFKTAGMGIAMGNAIPEIKKVAHFITDTNERNGVAKAIAMFF